MARIIGALVIWQRSSRAENHGRVVASSGRRDRSYEIRVRSHGDRLIVAVAGDVDVLAWRDLELMADAVAIADLDLQLDFAPLDFLDARGTTALADLVERLMRQGRSVELVNIPDHARRVIDLVAPMLLSYVADRRSSGEEGQH